MAPDFRFNGRVIGLLGKRRSGKNSVADIVVKRRGQTASVAFADKIKDICREVFAFSDEQLHGSLKEVSDKRYPTTHPAHTYAMPDARFCCNCDAARESAPEQCVSYLTPRKAMQLLGTEWGRACYAPVWVEYTFRKANELLTGVRVRSKPFDAGTGTSGKGSYIVDRTDLVFITDVRFTNEIRAVKEAGGEVWKIVRPSLEVDDGYGAHASEAEIDAPENDELLDAAIVNDGTLAELEEKVQLALG
jgi:hypothetical protein